MWQKSSNRLDAKTRRVVAATYSLQCSLGCRRSDGWQVERSNTIVFRFSAEEPDTIKARL